MAWLRFETPFGPMALEGETALTRLWLPGTLPDLRGRGEDCWLISPENGGTLICRWPRRGRTFSARFGRP